MAANPSRQSGITLLEFVLSVLVMSVMAFATLDRVASVLEGDTRMLRQIERVNVDYTVGAINSALMLESNQAYAQGEAERLQQWEGGNALDLIMTRDLLRGVFVDQLPGPGRWLYDGSQRQVVYDPKYAESEEVDGLWRWHVVLDDNLLKLEPVAVAGL